MLDQDESAAAAFEAAPAEEPGGSHPIFADAPASVSFKKGRKRLLRQMRETIETHAMARPGARWLVGISGGKDSYALLALLLDLRWRGLLPVDLLACNLDQGQPGFPKHILPEFLTRHGIAHRIEYRDTYSVVKEKVPEGATTCALCSRLRRGNLYRIAREEGCEALVLGHHLDDSLETFFLNMFFGGKLSAMPAKLVNDEGDLLVLRPLIQCAEADIARFSAAMRFPIIPCDLCGSQEGLQRGALKTLIADMEQRFPGRRDTIARALANVRPGHLLDTSLFDFRSLEPRSDAL
ncbi:tRNA 2-thiocytidine(32) synthetase TtcA [Aureimonas jatrophae]|uniref:tRNA-cytidine(32) 2-sulfurtransferase n=1 Tax=Aureimonas jatrophae TaxID=1166073 RepID=A0A1H0JJ15_9HYPH|nr:tRNA 2-thiocytidine(32) synthetase TtcA [Aureimonas jatrophae]MBB3951391.1 tRNA 2-thiocytidine biosynthesis protein TtcA [Aureimonas jatrophae]SDO43483.1 tRNA 2-thiocytidine biosynthesis protein TtcA [Aureimonas jatrophae]